VRAFFRGLLTRALLIFFRRIEVEGASRVPASGPVLFVANHPNSLVDPLLLLCFAPRPVSFLAKAPLFRQAIVGRLVRAFDSIPVYRPQDPGTDLAKNRETFESARNLLGRGGTLGLFPEGASHDEPQMLPLKTGAARIALGAASQSGAPLVLVPAGLYYTWKQRFRSSALLLFGDPFEVSPGPLDEDGSPPREAVRELTARIAAVLDALTLQAESREALELVRRADRIFAADERPGTLVEELSRRRRFVEGYRRLAARDPARLAAMEDTVVRFDTQRRAAGLSLEDLAPEGLDAAGVLRLVGRNLAALLIAPLAAAGVAVHYPAYRLAGLLARRYAGPHEDVLATAKVAFSIVLMPVTWAIGAFVAWRARGAVAGAAVLLLLPLSGGAALWTAEALDAVVGRARALLLLMSRGRAVSRLIARREAIRREILEVEEALDSDPR
jgi:glycerol-3-phosphate O-acyltransferase/dihydroxyacetone phosphate acyltransferase